MSRQLDTVPESISQVREIHHFENLAELVATSDLVVLAEVTDVRPGRWHGNPGADDSTQSRAVTLSIKKILWSGTQRSSSVPTSLVLDEEGWTSDGQGFQLEGLPWLSIGNTGVFAVDIDAETGSAFLVNTQARFLLDGPKVVPSGDKSTKLARAIDNFGRQELLNEFDAAVDIAKHGGAEPDAGLQDKGYQR